MRWLRLLCSLLAVATLKSAKSCAVAANAVAVSCILVANTAVLWCGNGELIVDFGGSMVRKWRLVVWLRGFAVWFLYDCGAIAAFGNL